MFRFRLLRCRVPVNIPFAELQEKAKETLHPNEKEVLEQGGKDVRQETCMPISPEYNSSFLRGSDYTFLRECIADLRNQHSRYGQKQSDMERVRKTAAYVGFDLDSAKPRQHRRATTQDASQ